MLPSPRSVSMEHQNTYSHQELDIIVHSPVLSYHIRCRVLIKPT